MRDVETAIIVELLICPLVVRGERRDPACLPGQDGHQLYSPLIGWAAGGRAERGCRARLLQAAQLGMN